MRSQNESRKGIRKVPGFRSNTLWKKIVAIITYVIIAIFAITALTEDGLPGLLFFIALLAIPLSLIALIKGGLRSIGISNRKVASLVLVISLVLTPFLIMFIEAPAERDTATDDVASAIEEAEAEPPEEPGMAVAEQEIEEVAESEETAKEPDQPEVDGQTDAEAERIAEKQAKTEAEATAQEAEEQAAEEERLAAEEKAAAEAAAQQAEEERLAREAEEKAAAEAAAQQAEEERLAREAEEKVAAEAAAEKAEEERLAAEAAAKEQAEQEAKAAAEEARQAKTTNATVTRVVDGDTLKASINGTTETVRLLLIDTPETVHPSEPVQPFGPEASQFVKDTLEGQEVRVKVGTEERDKYGRMLAYVYIGDETIQEKLLKNGLAATAYLYNDLSMLEEFHSAQQSAIDAGIGVWSISDYAHVDHNHGFHYEEAEPEPEESEPEPESAPSEGLEYDPAGPDRDCGDFSSQAAAQAFMEAAGDGDRHRLDGNDNDGLACESLG